MARGDAFNLRTGMHIHFSDHSVTTRDIIPVRYTTPALMELTARASRKFELLAVYADFTFTRLVAQC
jgi:hypothetical protein